MASLKDLASNIQKFFGNVGRTASDIGQGFGIAAKNYTNYLGKEGQRLTSPQFYNQPINTRSVKPFARPAVQAFNDYAGNQVLGPISQGVQQFKQPGVGNKAMGALQIAQGGFGATPIGAAWNVGIGGTAGAIGGLRTGQPLLPSIYKGATQPTSLATEGLGIENPYIALGADLLLTRNPKNLPGQFKSITQNPTKVGKVVDVLKLIGDVKATPGQVKGKGFTTQYNTRMAPADREQTLQILDRWVMNKQNLSYAAGQGVKDEKFIRQMAADYISKDFAKKNDIGVVAQELANRTRVDQGLPEISLGIQEYGKDVTKNNPLKARAPKATQGGDTMLPPGQIEQGVQPGLDMPPSSGPSAKTSGVVGGNTPKGSSKLPKQVSESLDASIPDRPGFAQNDRDAFAGWVNARRASGVEGTIVKRKFQQFDDQGINAFFEVQAGKNKGKFKEVRGFLDKKYKQARQSGIEFNYQQDYLPQVWDNSPEEIAQVLDKRITTKPGFSLEKVIEDYKAGIEGGLTPRFSKLSDLLGWYESSVNKAVADREFLNYLRKNNLIMPVNGAPRDWVTLNPDRFPKLRATVGGMEVRDNGPFKAPRELAEMINNYLFNPKLDGNAFQRGLATIADYVSSVKNRALSFGVPFTAVNAHGINILARHTVFGQGGNMITRFVKGAYYLLNQDASGKAVISNLSEIPAAVKKGLSVSVEDRTAMMEATGFRNKFGQVWSKIFEEALFDKMIPSLKFDSYKALVKDFSKTMPLDQAQREAAKIANNIYGGINWEQVGRSRDLQNFFRSVILAPDWAETTLRLGGNFAKSMVSNTPQAAKYRNMVASMATAYFGANIANKLSSGHWMWENEPGHTFEIETGYTDDGQKRYLRPFGTAADMFRLPYDTVLSLAKGDVTTLSRTVRNRLSMPAGFAVGALTDTDYRGQPIGYRGTDRYGNEIPLEQRVGSIGGELGNLIGIPAFTKQIADTATGRQGIEQGIVQGFELPFRYTGGAYSSAQKQIKEIADTQGLKGKDLYDLNQKLRGQREFSEQQMEVIRQGGLDTVLQQRANNQAENKAREEARNTGGITEANGKIFYPDGDEIKSVQLDRKLEEPQLTGQASLDKELMSAFSSQITAKINDIETLYKLGRLSAEEAGAAIDQLKSYQKSVKAKYAAPKKPKKIAVSIAKVKIASTNIRKSATKSPTLKLKKAPTFRMSKPKTSSIKLSSGTVKIVRPKPFRNDLMS